MSISEQIRVLAREGLTVAEIASQLNIRYQFAYGVLRKAGLLASKTAAPTIKPISSHKQPLPVDELIKAGFSLSSRWMLSQSGELKLERPLPKEVGVYAFAMEGAVQYAGVATMGLAKRIYFYGKPGSTQRTSQRINEIIKNELKNVSAIDVYTAIPPDSDWNGLPIHGSAGLELGLIKKYSLPWNKRGAN